MQAHQATRQTINVIRRFRNFRYTLVLEGAAVGILAAVVTVLFRIVLEQLEHVLPSILSFGKQNPWFIAVWFCALACLAAVVMLLFKWEPMISGSGIPQVEGEMQGQLDQTWWRVLIAKFIGGILTIGAGLSLGREGPSIQLGAMASKGFSKLTGRIKTEEKLLITCGAAAGLSAAFNAPFAGVLFALEELHKNFSVEVLLSTMTASVTADFISRYVFGLQPIFEFHIQQMMPLTHYGLVLLLGILLGLLGTLYNSCISRSQALYGKIPNLYLRILLPFLLAGVLGFTLPDVLGGGHGLVEMVGTGQIGIVLLLVLLVVKFLFSMASFGSGAPGGIFLPLLVLGALAGGAYYGVVGLIPGMDQTLLQNFVILGMAGMFSAIVRAPITGIILISEMTGGFSHLLTLSLVSLSAYITADLLRSKPVYESLLERLLSRLPGRKERPTGEKVLIDTPVCHGAKAEHKNVSQIAWPEGCLLVSLIRGSDELLPKGDTEIRSGDRVVALCDESVSSRVHDLLESEFGKVADPPSQDTVQ